jgi:hypothetical protein
MATLSGADRTMGKFVPTDDGIPVPSEIIRVIVNAWEPSLQRGKLIQKYPFPFHAECSRRVP